MRFRLLLLFISLSILTLNTGCERTFSCEDGLQNQGETGIDCGGPCINCGFVASCFDGTQNQDETGIDCGGVCPDCVGTDPTCSDGIQNGDETGVDCGGSCTPCGGTPTCTDGIQNGDETGVDCGGSCDPCSFGCGNPDTTNDIFTASVGGGPFGADIVSVQDIGGNLVITATALDGNTITLTHNDALAVGTYPLGAAAFETGGMIWSTVTGGTGEITIDSYDTSDCTMDGSFFFNAENSSGSNLDITNGIFENLDF